MRARSRYRLLGPLLCALALAGCAHENPQLIAQDRADELTATVDEVAQLVADHDCAGARKAVAHAERQVAELPASTSQRLRRNLRAWLNHLDERVRADCTKAKQRPTPTPTTTEPPTTTPTPTTTVQRAPGRHSHQHPRRHADQDPDRHADQDPGRHVHRAPDADRHPTVKPGGGPA